MKVRCLLYVHIICNPFYFLAWRHQPQVISKRQRRLKPTTLPLPWKPHQRLCPDSTAAPSQRRLPWVLSGTTWPMPSTANTRLCPSWSKERKKRAPLRKTSSSVSQPFKQHQTTSLNASGTLARQASPLTEGSQTIWRWVRDEFPFKNWLTGGVICHFKLYTRLENKIALPVSTARCRYCRHCACSWKFPLVLRF